MILNWIKEAPGACFAWVIVGVLIAAVIVGVLWPGSSGEGEGDGH